MFKMNTFKKELQTGLITDDSLSGYIQYSKGLWVKRLSTEFLMNYVTYTEVVKEDISINILGEEERIGAINNRIVEFAESFELEKDHTDLLAQFIEDRDYLSGLMSVISAYGDIMEMLLYIFNRNEAFDGSEIENDEVFIGKVINYLFSVEDNVVINDKVHDVFSQIPIRMSKNKFYNMLELSMDMVKGASERSMNEYVTYLRESFNPKLVEGYGTYLKDVSEEINQIEANLDNLEDQSIVIKSQEKIHVLTAHIMDRISFYLMQTNLVNLMIALLKNSNEGSVSECNEHVSHVKHTLDQLKIRKENDQIIDDMIYHLLSKLEGVIEESSMQLMKYEGINNQLLDFGVAEPYCGSIKAMNQSYLLTSGSYYGKLEELEESPVASNLYVAKCKNDMIDYMKEVFTEDSKWVQRARIAKMLKIINIVQTSPKDIYDFLMTHFKGCKNETEKYQSQRLINQYMLEDEWTMTQSN